MKKVLIIVGIVLIILLIIAKLFFRLIFNPDFETTQPQKHFIEIRPIVYGVPTLEMRKLSDKGEIILGGDSFAVPRARYAILIKAQPEESDEQK